MNTLGKIAASRSPSTERNDAGLALVLALLFIVLLTALVVEFAYEVQVEASHAANVSGNLEARLAAQSAIQSGLALLAADLYELPAQGRAAAQQLEGGVSGAEYDGFDEQWALGIPMAPLNQSIMQCRISDEYGKINLNALLERNDRDRENPILVEALRLLFANRETENDPTDAILDWLDEDDSEQGSGGAEESFYQSLEIPYRPKNGPMESIEELLLIAGITPEVYYGDPQLEQLPLSELLTVRGHPDGIINANTAQVEVMAAMIEAADLSATAFDNWGVRMEDGTPYTSEEDLAADGLVLNPQDQQQLQEEREAQQAQQETEDEPVDRGPQRQIDLFTVQGDVFRLRGDGLAGEVQVRIEAYVRRDRQGIEPDMFRVLDWRIYQ